VTTDVVTGFFFTARFEKYNATVRWTVACRQLDGDNTIIFANDKNANESRHSSSGNATNLDT